MEFGHHNAPPLEMPKSLSPFACAATTLACKTKVASSIEITYLKKMQKSLSTDACAAKSLFSAKTDAKRLNGVKQNHCKTLGKPYILIDSRGRLITIGGTKFEAKCPQAGPL